MNPFTFMLIAGEASGDLLWSVLAERSGDSAFEARIAGESGVALRLPPQSIRDMRLCAYSNETKTRH